METTCCKIFFFMYGHSPQICPVKKYVKMARLSGGDPDQFVEDGAAAPSWLPHVN